MIARSAAWAFLLKEGDTLVDDEIVGLPLDVPFPDASEEKTCHGVLSREKSTSSPIIAISLFPSAFLKTAFMLFYDISINQYPHGV